MSENFKLEYINPLIFLNLKSLDYLSLRQNSITSLDPSLAYLRKRVKILDLRDNPFTCNCSIQWIRKLLIDYQSRSKSNASKFTFSIDLNRDDKVTNTHSLLSTSKTSSTNDSVLFSLINLSCALPFPLRGKLIIYLNPDDIGCVEVESMAPIIIGVIIGLLFFFGVIMIFAIRFKSQLTDFIKGSGVQKHHFPNKIVTINNNNRKIFGLSTITNDFDYHQYAKPDYIVVHNMINAPSTTINPLSSNPYEVVPIRTNRIPQENNSPLYQSEFSHYPFRPRPITDL